MPLPLTVVIATHTRRPVLELALEALAGQTFSEFRIVVVDDGSSDDTWEWLQARSEGSPELTAIRQDQQGQGPARNRALREVDGGLVLFMGDDIIALSSFVAEHLAAHREGVQPLAVVGFTDWCRTRMQVTPLLEMINREGHQFGYAHMTPGGEVPFTCFYTSNVSVPRQALGEDPFDSSFTAYGWEDVELGYRLSRGGVRLCYHPGAAAEHLHPMGLVDVYDRQRQVGRGIHALLELHPELSGDPRLAPRQAPPWFRYGRHVIPRLLPALAALDRWRLPMPVRVLHAVLQCAYYLGRDEAG